MLHTNKILTGQIDDEITRRSGINLLIRREDLIHPFISGNKFRKLKYNLEAAKRQFASQLITFGGAYSNHILAVAAAGYENNFKTVGVIRGEKNMPLNPTLDKARNRFGMRLVYVDRSDYRSKSKESLLDMLEIAATDSYIIPEGGTNTLAIRGCAEMVENLNMHADYICCSCGTGGTLAGIICGMDGKARVLGFSALKGDFLKNDIERLVYEYSRNSYFNWEVNTSFHFGGYAKFNDVLIDFINRFRKLHQIPLDPIYTGKMMYGIYELMKNGFFRPGAEVVAMHTGGLQGIEGFNRRFGNVIN